MSNSNIKIESKNGGNITIESDNVDTISLESYDGYCNDASAVHLHVDEIKQLITILEEYIGQREMRIVAVDKLLKNFRECDKEK